MSEIDVSQLLIAWSNGDQAALDQLIVIARAWLHKTVVGNPKPVEGVA